jgi:hypothetical protein
MGTTQHESLSPGARVIVTRPNGPGGDFEHFAIILLINQSSLVVGPQPIFTRPQLDGSNRLTVFGQP